MSSAIKIDQLIEAAARLLRDRVLPALEGDVAFETRVAANALDIAVRELRQSPETAAAHVARLEALLGQTGSAEALDAMLCDRLREGRFDGGNAALIAHLRAATEAALAIDQPRYSALRRKRPVP